MFTQMEIVEVFKNRKVFQKENLILRVRRVRDRRIFYMNFSNFKKKYPLVLLEYLASNIVTKENQFFPKQGQMETELTCEYQNTSFFVQSQPSRSNKAQGELQNISFSSSYSEISLSESKDKLKEIFSKILDCDIYQSKNHFIPVFFIITQGNFQKDNIYDR